MQSLLHKFLKILSLVLISWQASFAATVNEYPFCDAEWRMQTDQTLEKILSDMPDESPQSVSNRIQYFNHILLDKPYILTALGEGPKARYDQAPLYRLDGFDCQTYVETILALALSDSVQHFKQCIQKIRYAHGKNRYLKRHHFTAPDWNAFNQQQGILKDITASIVDHDHHSKARYAHTVIDQAAWYQHFDRSKIRLCQTSPTILAHRLKQLQKSGQSLPRKTSRIAYLPIQDLVAKNKQSQYLLDQIPHGAIIEIVRPNWDLTKLIGTHLNVSHLGFAIREHGELYFYNASSLVGKSCKPTLVEYLISMQSQPSIQGINIQIVRPTHLCQHD